MRKTIVSIVVAVMLVPLTAAGQTYGSLWNREKAAEKKDMPKTQIGVLREIEEKAGQEKAYGQLLKAVLKRMKLTTVISPDSIESVTAELRQREAKATDGVLKAVYDAVLYRVYTDNGQHLDGADSAAVRYRRLAMAEPGKLAAANASGFEPFVVKGLNAAVFDGDMLSVLGYEVEDFETLWHWYKAAGNRRAACMAALELLRQHRPESSRGLKKSEYIQSLDSITHAYGDLDVACEAAIERYEYMSQCHDVTVEDEIRYIHYALDKWGGWQGAGRLRNAEKELTAPMLRAEATHDRVRPGESQTLKLGTLRNIESLTMNIYRVAADGDTELDIFDWQKMKPLLTELPDRKLTRTFVSSPAYNIFSDSLVVGGLPAGVYLIELETSPSTETVRRLYYVSDVFCMSQALPGDSVRYVVVSATTGQPLPGAKIRIYNHRHTGGSRPQVTLTCDARGEAIYKYDKNRPNFVYAYTDKDKACPRNYGSGTFGYGENNRQTERIRLFTDRSIYRPGQTVRMAAVMFRKDNATDYSALEGKSVKVALRDTNYKVVTEQELVTDRYGSCSADFVLPAGVLTGRFTLTANSMASASIRVEEYKRPTFQVEFPEVNEKYQNGDTLMVRAKALTYAGVPVQGAKVEYTVKRRPALWWRYCKMDSGYEGIEVLASGETATESDGSFVVNVPMVLPEEDGRRPMFYNFEVEAQVTDIGGETHSGTMSIPLGSRPTAFSCDLPEKVLGDSLKTVTFSLRNAAGMEIAADVFFCIDGSKPVTQAHTGRPFDLIDKLSSGRHRLYAVCENDTLTQDFVVFGLDDTVPCTQTPDWFYVSSETFPADGGKVTLQAGSSDKDLHIVYTIISGNKVLESGAVDKDGTLVNRKFTYKEEYGNGLLFNFAWVKDGRCYNHRATISRPVPDKRLRMRWTTFRDKLKPGQTEEWSLNVTMPDGKPADALLMATLYDKSLDRIVPHGWSLAPSSWLPLPHTSWVTTESGSLWFSAMQQWRYLAFKEFAPSRIDASLFPGGMFYDHIMMHQSALAKDEVMKTEAVAMEHYELSSVKVRGSAKVKAAAGAFQVNGHDESASDMEDALGAADGGSQGGEAVQMRENMNETALFVPDAHTDAEGNVTLKFTLPESLTTWRFIGQAHTADMLCGTLGGETVARKDVMIQPNMPRFVRTGDHVKLSARIFNTGEAEASGKARMEMIDPETERIVAKSEQAFSVKPGETGVVTFDYEPNGDNTLLICRITASGKTFSDGEQHYLPVLPDRERVTVTVPFTQPGAGTKAIDISKLFPEKAVNGKLTVEYTNNPAWLMVQALPSVGTPRDGNAIDLAASLYANTVAYDIIKQNPKIKAAFGQWKHETAGDGQSLQSNLTKNSELKDIVLSETPWVADADRETEQKQRLADFFDESALQNRMASVTDKLSKLQREDGSWSWWPGMEGSLYMTVEVAQMLVRMNAMTGSRQASGQMLDRAFGYMGKQIVKEVNELKKAERRGTKPAFPGGTALRFLYLSAIDGRRQSAAVQSASDYLIALLKKEIKQQTIYDKALTTIILSKHGETARSREYVKSLKEYTVFTEEAGRYYDTRRASYSWFDYRIPTEVAAIEAIAAVTPEDTLTIDEMRRWLLHEKRTQAWDTPINSVNAIHSFLSGNGKVLASQARTVLAIDGKTLDVPKSTAGIGYVKTSVAAPAGKTFTATKTSQGTSWGALYAQFMQKTSEVKSQGSGISIKREMFVKDESGERKVESGDKGLERGSRIVVRITVEAKHDLDFVQVVDRRAACMEPVGQLSGYRNGAYCSPKDNATYYYFDRMAKGKHVIETEYYVDRTGTYETGTCSVGCAYAPEYRATAKSNTITVK